MKRKKSPKSKKAIKSKKKYTVVEPKTIKKPPFTLVGMGASAGGLEAFEQFFLKMPSNSGLSFVVVSHLDRTHHSILPDLINKYTDMEVLTIKNRMKVRPNCVYVLPPNKNVTIEQNVLTLIDQGEPHYANQAIDIFFQSLAEDQKESAVGIILSGTGRDGTAGLKAIKKEDGVVFVQDPMTAKYSGMPQTAIDTGLVDHILPPERIPEQLIKWLQFGFVQNGKISQGLQQIFNMLRAHTGHDFSSYKLNTICRRIERQMNSRRIDTLADYVRFLRLHPHEISNLLKDLLIGVTSFFRDPQAYDALKKEILPGLLKDKSIDYTFRVWVPGCSTGEEVYSIAMIIRETMEELKHHCNVQIFGTDIDLVALESARSGVYAENKVFDISSERLKAFFVRERNKYKIDKEIRKMVVFGAQNIIKDPPFTKLDMICCRNLLIYLNSQQQKKLFPLFHYSLKPKGILFLGTSESVSESVDLFKLIIKKWKIFERKDVLSFQHPLLEFPTAGTIPMLAQLNSKPPYKYEMTDEDYVDKIPTIRKYLLDHYISPCVVVNSKGIILFIHGAPSSHWNITTQDYKSNLSDILPKHLRLKIKNALKEVTLHKKEIHFKNIRFHKTDKQVRLDLKIIPVEDHFLHDVYLIVLEEVFTSRQKKLTEKKYSSAVKMSKKILELERELQYTKENLQTSIEELQSNNEELQSTNEELQSTNEEIETSKEELQSLNEELVISNTELQNQIDQLASVNDDINNLFNSTEVAAIFLDTGMHVKRFTPKAQNIVHLIHTDIGRSFEHFASNIIYDNLIQDALDVIKHLHQKSFEVKSKDGKWYNIRILPYKTIANVIDGVIITFLDITEHKVSENNLKKLNEKLRHNAALVELIANLLDDPFVIISRELTISFANQSFYKTFNLNHEISQPIETIFQTHSSLAGFLENAFTKSVKKEQHMMVQHDNKSYQMQIKKIVSYDDAEHLIIIFQDEK